MKKLIKICLSLSLGIMFFTVTSIKAMDNILTEVSEDGYQYYCYDALKDGYTSSRSDVLTPTYYIFAGNQDITSANSLVEELGMLNTVRTWAASVYIINPLDNDYGQADLTKFETLIKQAPIKNAKVIGINKGATFVNNYLSQKCNYIAGMLLVGGNINSSLINDTPVPTYLSDSNNEIITYYQKANAVDTISEGDNYILHTNSSNPLQAVAIAKNKENLATAFINANKSIFTKNYRYHNSIGEFYNLPILNEQQDILELEYDLVQTPIFDDLKIKYNEMIHQTVSNMPGNDYAWFEYIPEITLSSQDKSVPLVITIHGNQNDPRIQGDTTGWVELAAQEKFMVISPEYQTAKENAYFTQPQNTNIYGTVDGLQADGIINLIKDLQIKYPQIDPSRIYVTGLSQGGAMTSLLGIRNSDIFAAAASVSGVNVFGSQINE